MRTSHKILLSVVAAVVIIVAAVAMSLTLPNSRLYIVQKAIIAGAGARDVRVGSMGGVWPWHIALEDVDISDTEGVWLHVDRFDLKWHPVDLLFGETKIDSVEAGTATILRWPVKPPDAKPSPPPDIDSVRRSLAHLTVGRLAIESLIVKNTDEKRTTVVAITGAAVPQKDGRLVALDVQRKDKPGNATLRLNMTRTRTTAEVRGDISQFSGNGSIFSDVGTDAISGNFHVACASEGGCYKWSEGELGAGQLDLTIGGSLSHPTYAADVRLSDVALGPRRAEEFTGKLTLSEGEKKRKQITAEGTITGMATAVPEVAAVVAKEGTWSAAGSWVVGTATIEDVRIESGGLTLQASGIAKGDQLSNVKLLATVQGAGRLAGLKQDKSTTTATVTFDQLSMDAASGLVDVDVTGIAHQNGLPHLTGGDLHLKAHVNLDDGKLTATDIAGTWGGLALKGDSAWSTEKTFAHTKSEIALTAAFKDMSALPKPVTAKVTATGPLANLKLNIDGGAPEVVSLPGRPLTNVALKLNAERNGPAWRGSLKSTAQSKDAPLVLDAAFNKSQENELAVTDLRLTGNGPLAQGNARVDLKTGLAEGAFGAKDAGFVGLAQVFGVTVAIPGSVRVDLARRTGKQDVILSLDATQVVANGIVADQLNGSATVNDAYGDGRMKANLTLRDGNVFGRDLSSLVVKANGGFANIAVETTAKGSPTKPFTLTSMANVAIGQGDKSATTITFQRLTTSSPRLKGELASPARLTISPAEIALAPFRANVGGGSVSGQLRLDNRKATAAGKIKIENVTIGANQLDFDANVAVVLSGEMNVSGPATNATLDAVMSAKYRSPERQYPVTSNYTLKLKNGHAVFTGTAAGLSKEDMHLAADIPARLDVMGGRLIVDRDAPMTASLLWNGDITALWQLIAIDQHVLSGKVAADVRAHGTLADPRITGRIHLTEGRYENFVSLTTMRDLDIDLAAMEGNAFAVNLAATDGNGGKISASGKMTPATLEGWKVAVNADLDHFHLLRRDDLSGAATGKVAYAGTLTTGDVTGSLSLDRAEMVMGASYIPEVPLLRGRPGELLEEKKEAGFSTVRLAVALKVADVVRVSGKGLESFWRGSLNAGGTVAHPDITGSLTLARGTFSFVGQQFQLDEGTVTFTGGGAINPELNISASKQATDITATLAITGTARFPTIALTSNPSVPRDEVLARLMFRKEATQLGPVESVQLASAAAELSGLTPGGINGLLRKPLGLDTVSVGGRTGKSLVLGRQVTNSLYIGAEQDLEGSDREIVIERRLTPTLSLKSTTSDKTGGDIGIIWRKNY
jgi:translocation and assembly module TamB